MTCISETTFTNSVMTKVSGNQSSAVNAKHVYSCRDHIISACPIILALTLHIANGKTVLKLFNLGSYIAL